MGTFTNEVVAAEAVPELPEEAFRPVERAQLTVELSIVALITLLALAAAGTVVLLAAAPWWLAVLVPGAVAMLGLAAAGITYAAFSQQGWLLREHDLSHRHGILLRRQVTVPLSRVQHTSVAAGPIDRLLGLSKLQVFTASGGSADLVIAGLKATDAVRLRERVVGRGQAGVITVNPVSATDTARFSQPRRTDARGMAIDVVTGIRRGMRTYGLAAVIAIVTSRGRFVLAVLALALLSASCVAVLHWLRRTYCVRDGAFVLSSGILSRRVLSIPVPQIQGLSIDEPLLNRLLGVVRVRVDSAGSSTQEIDLSAVRAPDAEALRRVLIEHREGLGAPLPTAAADAGEPSPASEENSWPTPLDGPVLLRRSTADLVLVGLTRNPARFMATAAISAITFGDELAGLFDIGVVTDRVAPTGVSSAAALSAVLLAALAVLASMAAVVRYHGLRLDFDAGRFRARFGLFERRQRVVPNARVQLIVDRAELSERLVGRRTVELRSIGAAGSADGDSAVVVLPGSLPSEAEIIVAMHLGVTDASAALPTSCGVDRALIARGVWWGGALPGIVIVGAVVIGNGFGLPAVWATSAATGWVALWWWYRRALWQSWRWSVGSVVAVRSGVVTDVARLAQTPKIQAVQLRQNLFERRRGLATIVARTAAGPLRVPYLPLGQARRVRDELLYRIENSTVAWM